MFKFLVESVYAENTHIILQMKQYVVAYAPLDPMIKSVGKQVVDYIVCPLVHIKTTTKSMESSS